VDDEHVLAGRGRLPDAIEDDSRRVGALLAGDHRCADALAPDLELLDRGRAKGVAGGEQHAIILLLEPVGELADRGRLARAVDAGEIVGDPFGSLLEPAAQAIEPTHAQTAVSWLPSLPVMRARPAWPRVPPARPTGAKLSVWPLPSPSTRIGWTVATRLSSQ